MAASTNRVIISGSERTAIPGATVTGTPSASDQIEVSIILRPRKSGDLLKAYGTFEAVRPAARKYMSRETFGQTFGADPADVVKVEAFAQNYGLTVMEVSLPRRTVVLAGTVSQLSEAFGATLNTSEHAGVAYRSRTGALTVPGELDGIIEGVFGLDNRPQARPHFRLRPGKPPQARAVTAVYTANQVAGIYNFPTGTDGSGQCIGIIEFGGGYQQSDLQSYFSQLGIAVPSVTAVSVDGVQNQPMPGPNSPDGEVALDIEVAGAAAPGSNFAVYFSDFTERGWVDAITTAVHDTLHKPSVISISWGYPEGELTWTQQAMQAVSQAFQAAAAMGVTVCCASGDDGSRDEVSDGLTHVDFPASSPYVLACGGTTLLASSNVISSEVVWNDGVNGGASGGGVSAVFPLPSWQSQANVPPSVNPGHQVGRGVPDVAGDADPNTGYQVIADGQPLVVGGTSAVAPLWAALIARINQKLGKPAGYLNPLIYPPAVSSHGAFHDITSGNNDITGQLGGYQAVKGWDACTGWGSPNGTGLLAALAGGASSSIRKRVAKRSVKKGPSKVKK